jgi:hypothetical protein
MKSLSHDIKKIWPMLKFLKSGSRLRSKNLVSIERSFHKEHTYEIPITFLIFADRQTDGQAKNYIPPIFRYGGIKKILKTHSLTDIKLGTVTSSGIYENSNICSIHSRCLPSVHAQE